MPAELAAAAAAAEDAEAAEAAEDSEFACAFVVATSRVAAAIAHMNSLMIVMIWSLDASSVDKFHLVTNM